MEGIPCCEGAGPSLWFKTACPELGRWSSGAQDYFKYQGDYVEWEPETKTATSTYDGYDPFEGQSAVTEIMRAELGDHGFRGSEPLGE